jgi:predicted phage terminase large subunit-like protein
MPSYKPNPGQQRATALLTGPQRHTLLAGGARSGKTFLLTRAVVTRALRGEGSRHAILRFRANAARSSIALDTLPKVMSVCYPEVGLTEHRQDGFFELPNKSQIWIGGLDDKDRVEKILGQEYATLYLNECSQIPYASVVVARTRLAQQVEGLKQRAYYDLNPGGANHWTNLEFGRHVDPISGIALSDPDNYQRAFISPEENADNLSEEFLESLRNLPTKQRKRFFEGEYIEEIDGALWTIELLDQHRAEARPDFKRIVIAIDPSGSSGDEDKRSDEVGVIVAGLGEDSIAYVLEDLSGRHGPGGDKGWAAIAVSAYERWGADAIVAETNYGGAMVKEVIRARGAHIPFREVKASRGKHVRAEPIATLYAQGKVRHFGRFPRLEDQLLAFSSAGYTGDRSPDRADAMVWAISDLFPALLAEKKPGLVAPKLRPPGGMGAQGWMGR